MNQSTSELRTATVRQSPNHSVSALSRKIAISYLPLTALFLMLMGLNIPTVQAQESPVSPPPSSNQASSAQQLLHEVLQAHGSLEKWNSFKSYTYDIPDFPLGAKAPMAFNHQADLHQRKHLMIDHNKNYTLGFDGKNAWAVNPENAGIPARFVTVGNSYFAMMPFVFADNGVYLQKVGQIDYRGKSYKTIDLSFNKNAGDSADDVYTLFIDPETKVLQHITFTVTYKALRGDTPVTEVKRKIMTFHNWQDVQGLKVPAKVSLNAWNKGNVEGDGAAYHIKNVKFSKSAPDANVFAQPENAVVDNTHQ